MYTNFIGIDNSQDICFDSLEINIKDNHVTNNDKLINNNELMFNNNNYKHFRKLFFHLNLQKYDYKFH